MRIERDQRRTIAVLGLMLLATVSGLWLPLHLREAGLREAIARASVAAGGGTTDTAHLVPLAREVSDLQARAKAGTHSVPEEPCLASLLKSISADLDGVHVTDAETQSQATISGTGFSIIPIQLRFRTTFAHLYRFLCRVESMRRLVRVTRLDVSRPDADAPKAGPRTPEVLSISIELCTFFAPPEGAKP